MSKLKKLTRKTVPLKHLTRSALEAGAIQEGETIEAVIRRVRASDVAAQLGIPPNIYRVQLDLQKGEDPQEQKERLERAMSEDEDLLNDSLRMNDRQARLVVHVGTVHVNVPGEEPMPVAFEETNDDNVLSPSDLGDDFNTLHNEIVRFSSLPYGTLDTVPLREGEGMTSFPGERVASDPEPDGGTVRDDSSKAPS